MRTLVVIMAALAAVSCASPPTSPAPQQQPTPGQPSNPLPPPQPARGWDVDTQGIPTFGTHNYIDLAPIRQVSRFRSGVGHDYWDDYERCRSMKHYFMTPQGSAARDVRIYAPFTGEIVHTHQEWAGWQIHIRSRDYPAFTAVLFHVNPAVETANGTPLQGGQQIGTHIGDMTMSDITIMVEPPQGGRRLISWFHVMTDAVFDTFRARGATSRDQFVITKAERDANPLTCNGEYFVDSGTIPNWVELR